MEKKTKIKFSVLAIIAIIIFCAAITPITLQNDTYYTVKIGEYILQNGIDMHDPFSWHDLPYTYPHWGYDVLMYLIYNIAGMAGIYVVTIILASVLGIVLYITNVKLTSNRLISFLITFGVIFLLEDYIAARAQLVTFILFALTIYFIEKFIDTKKKRYAIGLIIIATLIANIHVAVWPFYFILFMPYIGEYIVYLLAYSNLGIKIKRNIYIKKLKKDSNHENKSNLEEKINELSKEIETKEERQKNRRDNSYKIVIEKKDNVKLLIIIMIICILTGLLTPLGDTPYTYLVKTMQGNTTHNINEHLPLTLVNSPKAMAVVIILIAMLMFTDTKIKLRDLFMIGGLLLLAFYSRRQLSMLFIIGSFILNRLIFAFLNKYDREISQNSIKAMTTFNGKVITLLLVILVSILVFKPKVNDKFISESTYPVKASEYILNNLDINNIRIYNEYNY